MINLLCLFLTNINNMKYEILLLFILFSVTSLAQIKITAKVKDSQTDELLSYCNVSVLGTGKGTITNADGVFCITVDTTKDILEFSYLGYATKTIFASYIKKDKNVFLQKNTYELQEVEIYADNDYLYDILIDSKKKLQKNNSEYISKAYYAIETKATPLEVHFPDTTNCSSHNQFVNKNTLSLKGQQEKTVELLECFYNASIVGNKIEELKFRNGRVFSMPSENYFISLQTSKVMGQFCFFEKNEHFPSCPFQYGKNAIKRIFNLELLSFDGKSYHIKFYPYNNSKKYFSGDMWIDKKSKQVLKINLMIDSAEIYPLSPIIDLDTVKNFNLNIINSFNPQKEFLLDYTVFDYSFDYVSRRDTIVRREFGYKRTKSKINSTGIVYYYDYDDPFILPFFKYEPVLNDYLLMSLFPYNINFWNANEIVQLTENQKNKFNIGKGLNEIENDCSIENGKIFLKEYCTKEENIRILSFYYIFWSESDRVIVTKSSIIDSIPKDVQQTPYPDQLYNIEVQILLDATKVGDSIVCKSWTVFDTMKSFYKYEETELTMAFLNIYFDICEIERRKMQQQLDENKYTLSEIEIIYNLTTSQINKITKQFVQETDRGRDDKFIKKWNKYVLENLGIDNLKLVQNTEKRENQ